MSSNENFFIYDWNCIVYCLKFSKTSSPFGKLFACEFDDKVTYYCRWRSACTLNTTHLWRRGNFSIITFSFSNYQLRKSILIFIHIYIYTWFILGQRQGIWERGYIGDYIILLLYHHQNTAFFVFERKEAWSQNSGKYFHTWITFH